MVVNNRLEGNLDFCMKFPPRMNHCVIHTKPHTKQNNIFFQMQTADAKNLKTEPKQDCYLYLLKSQQLPLMILLYASFELFQLVFNWRVFILL